MEFNLRKLVKSDLHSYKNIRMRAFQESPRSFSESFEDEKNQPIEFFSGCMGKDTEHFSVGCFTQENHLVAFATFKRDQRLKARHKSYIHTMYVIPEARGKKMAFAILNNLIGTAKTMLGLEQIHLWVLNPDISVAKSVYLKAGFVAQGTVIKNDLKINGAYVDAEYMTLFLN